MNYTQEGRRYIANDGYIFSLRSNPDSYAKIISIRLIDYYDCVPEPQPDPEPEQEDEYNGESDISV